MPMKLSAEQVDAYNRDGFIVIENLVPSDEVESLRDRLREYTHGGRQSDSISITIEPRIKRGELKVDNPGDGIRKVGNLVQADDLFRALGLNQNIIGILEQILGPDIKIFRNDLLMKPPEVGSQKGWHQDSPYWPIEPMALCSCWLALDDATAENGCLSVLRGWHKKGPLPHIKVTDDFVIDQDHRGDSLESVLAPVSAGGGVFFHSLLPHYTAPNRSEKWRRAIALSYMSAKSRYTKEGEGPNYFHVKGKTHPGCVR